MIIKEQNNLGICTTVGEVIDALQGIDKELPVEIGVDSSLKIIHIKGEQQEDEICDYTEFVILV